MKLMRLYSPLMWQKALLVCAFPFYPLNVAARPGGLAALADEVDDLRLIVSNLQNRLSCVEESTFSINEFGDLSQELCDGSIVNLGRVTGERGPTGANCYDGIGTSVTDCQGLQGETGPAGANCYDGFGTSIDDCQGVAGPQGIQGERGLAGNDGADGVCLCPEDPSDPGDGGDLVPIPIAYWPGEGNTNDVIGGNNGIVVDGIDGPVQYTPGVVGQAFSLSGGTYIEVPETNPSDLDLNGPFTIDAWISPDALFSRNAGVNNAPIAGKWGSSESGSGGYGIFLFHTGQVVCIVQQSGQTRIHSVQNLPFGDEQWHHVACAYTGTAVNLFINGQLEGSVSYSGNLNVHDVPFTIGGYHKFGLPNAVHYIEGRIDEVHLFGSGLTEAEVQALYQLGLES